MLEGLIFCLITKHAQRNKEEVQSKDVEACIVTFRRNYAKAMLSLGF
jgi:hypothetical protein